MKQLNLIICAFAFALQAFAIDGNLPPTFIQGGIDIRYNSRNQRNAPGVVDRYTLYANVNNSVAFSGSIVQTPRIMSAGFISKNLVQKGKLDFDISCDVINPKNTNQTRNVGKIFGEVPVDENNIYRFENGTARIIVLPLGVAKGFESKFRGLALGKPPVKSQSSIDKLVSEAVNITKNINGKAVKIAIAKYDKMGFQSHILAAGPVQIYPESTVNGDMLYDYARSAWHFQNVSILYSVDGKRLEDKLTGTVRWVENANEYQFDIRVNEPPPSEAAVFAGASDESAFFETDTSIPSLTGVMKYKDTKAGDTVTASQVTINLVGNKLTKQQSMNLFKLIILSSIVPINAE